MTKIYIKLITMALALALSASVVMMSSYAWMVLSGNPAATGIQVAVGGGNTILIAPNVKTEEGGKVYNYPGYFSESLNFGVSKEYEYLHNLEGLRPVSTANGIDWFLRSGTVDSELAYANLSKDEADAEFAKQCNYVYLDFWVVSPSGDHTLRVSTGEPKDVGGSFVIDLMNPVYDEETGYSLEPQKGSAAASVRIGFLANDVTLTDETMEKYMATHAYKYGREYTSLRGLYVEPKSGTPYLDADRFTIYEPNADYHPAKEEYSGCYVPTTPLAINAEDGYIWDKLAVQLSSGWKETTNGETEIAQKLKTATIASDAPKENANLFTDFYVKTLQGQIAPYVAKGRFIKLTENLESQLSAPSADYIAQENLSSMQTSGAAEDTYIIKLERNVPQRIRMFVWIESQDVDCSASAGSGAFAVNIE
ncbi:MAG: hypothetical protein IJM98_07700, partial [Oscillospiraceae bacterium]|nr:hypothetical protein [Oscillospiraceae bacterium]